MENFLENQQLLRPIQEETEKFEETYEKFEETYNN